MVVLRVTRLTYTPFDEDGFRRFRSASSASTFCCSLAGLFEVAWAIGLKYTDGFSRPLPTLLTLSAMAVSVLLLAMAVKQLPLGTAYAVWTGIGAVGTVLMGI